MEKVQGNSPKHFRPEAGWLAGSVMATRTQPLAVLEARPSSIDPEWFHFLQKSLRRTVVVVKRKNMKALLPDWLLWLIRPVSLFSFLLPLLFCDIGAFPMIRCRKAHIWNACMRLKHVLYDAYAHMRTKRKCSCEAMPCSLVQSPGHYTRSSHVQLSGWQWESLDGLLESLYRRCSLVMKNTAGASIGNNSFDTIRGSVWERPCPVRPPSRSHEHWVSPLSPLMDKTIEEKRHDL